MVSAIQIKIDKKMATQPYPKKLILQRTVAHYRVPLFNELSKHGWTVISASNFPNKISALHTQTTPHPFQMFTKFWFPQKSNPYLCHVPFFKILKKNQPEIILMEAGSTMTSTWLAALWGRLKKNRTTKVIFWGHGALVANKSGIKSKLATALKTWLINSVDGYMCYTKSDKACLESYNIKTPIFVAGNTVDISAPQKLRKAPSKGMAKNLLFVGRLTDDKKVPELIQLFKNLKQNHSDLTLTIIGDGPLQGIVSKEAKGIQGLNIAGAIYEEEKIAQYYNNADIYITLGAAGLGVNHALAYGLPVLCYKDSETGPHHHPEIDYIKEGVTGWQVSPYSKKAMHDKLETLLKKPIKAEMFSNITSYADSTLSIEHMAQNILNMESEV
jgi:glycosyltransferase involved in cell wall biosynthesis